MNTTQTTQKNSRDSERGALWLKKSKAGADFLSGYVLDEEKNKVSIVVFKNNFKKPGESSPDYRIYLSDNPVVKSTQDSPRTPSVENNAEPDSDTSDEIPF